MHALFVLEKYAGSPVQVVERTLDLHHLAVKVLARLDDMLQHGIVHEGSGKLDYEKEEANDDEGADRPVPAEKEFRQVEGHRLR